MAILKIARLGHPVLRQVADPIDPDAVTSPEVQRLIRDMLETVDDANGAGLAAPQVHASLRVVVLQLDPEVGMEVWVNPELTTTTTDQVYSFEGCLSVPGLRGMVARSAEVHVRGLDHTGKPFEHHLEGFPAIVAQHECDHLDGVIYVDKMEPNTLSFLEEHQQYGRLLWESEPDEAALDTDEEAHPDAQEGVNIAAET